MVGIELPTDLIIMDLHRNLFLGIFSIRLFNTYVSININFRCINIILKIILVVRNENTFF